MEKIKNYQELIGHLSIKKALEVLDCSRSALYNQFDRGNLRKKYFADLRKPYVEIAQLKAGFSVKGAGTDENSKPKK
jgi:hypothetical protein